MLTFTLKSLQQFISTQQLKKADGNILFNAEVKFNNGDTSHTVTSQVQIIVLANEIAVYILEFLKEEYGINEMYSTGHHHFSCPDLKALEIRTNKEDDARLISIRPIQ